MSVHVTSTVLLKVPARTRKPVEHFPVRRTFVYHSQTILQQVAECFLHAVRTPPEVFPDGALTDIARGLREHKDGSVIALQFCGY
mmetsp:Transcript_12492/g.45549  ORF Transcript_12492/g.45549 Transcript_12492/m.45549 type:complete len:85 (+) Transcript_12492:1538-1792(+)